MKNVLKFFFFFQAEDGIRDLTVTGVQTCALPICWVESPARAEERAPDRIQRDIAWLADPAREGRGIGSAGLEAAGAYVERRFRELGLAPERQSFGVPVAVKLEASSSIAIEDRKSTRLNSSHSQIS